MTSCLTVWSLNIPTTHQVLDNRCGMCLWFLVVIFWLEFRNHEANNWISLLSGNLIALIKTEMDMTVEQVEEHKLHTKRHVFLILLIDCNVTAKQFCMFLRITFVILTLNYGWRNVIFRFKSSSIGKSWEVLGSVMLLSMFACVWLLQNNVW